MGCLEAERVYVYSVLGLSDTMSCLAADPAERVYVYSVLGWSDARYFLGCVDTVASRCHGSKGH